MANSFEMVLCSDSSTGLGPGLCSLTSQMHFTKMEGSGELCVQAVSPGPYITFSIWGRGGEAMSLAEVRNMASL